MSILWGRGDMSENTAVSFLQRTFVLKSCPYGIVYKKKKIHPNAPHTVFSPTFSTQPALL
jgi:hypothetical protein